MELHFFTSYEKSPIRPAMGCETLSSVLLLQYLQIRTENIQHGKVLEHTKHFYDTYLTYH